MDIHYRPAQPADRPDLLRLLRDVDLRIDDLPGHLAGFWVAEAMSDNQLVGSAGIDVFGQVGLLRSVAVQPDYQQQHIARQLLERVLTQAQAIGLTNVYLLTSTASGYFARYGFSVSARETVPDAIRQTRQFSELCPDSAILMRKTL